jgi:FkbM family methyltransferase
MNQTILFEELPLSLTEKSSEIGGIWVSETDLSLQEEKWFKQIYNDLKDYGYPTVIDVGAASGCLSLFNALSKFPIYSFEPNKEAFHELIMNVYNNNCNTACYNIGLGERFSETYLDVHPELWGYGYNKVSNSITDHKIELYPLDSIIPFNTKITHVKIDVEGYELYVLKGMKRILEQKPILYLEMIEKNFSQFGYSSVELLNFLKEYGYNYFQIDENNYKFV